ncbi:hypothetical protein CYV26_11565 [Carnobacterium maltaromaticum]|nr:hypothetical protein CYV33_11550 [Carnobacterium maltaromaticum]PLS35728.1 hypothetical protein CYV30_08375 [Carnobacterium maltaromaticum]PLS36177.1 hypothetical protein CYV31_08380 [Carnobacterium maltaromaticum]PLS42634.1 hypothetical protein CYV27_11550 [Carnobacterium maltaromaticum]PLS42869.1 hypothetical protein CYV28_08390 [Carnobacterium maltaromaticum]
MIFFPIFKRDILYFSFFLYKRFFLILLATLLLFSFKLYYNSTTDYSTLINSYFDGTSKIEIQQKIISIPITWLFYYSFPILIFANFVNYDCSINSPYMITKGISRTVIMVSKILSIALINCLFTCLFVASSFILFYFSPTMKPLKIEAHTINMFLLMLLTAFLLTLLYVGISFQYSSIIASILHITLLIFSFTVYTPFNLINYSMTKRLSIEPLSINSALLLEIGLICIISFYLVIKFNKFNFLEKETDTYDLY